MAVEGNPLSLRDLMRTFSYGWVIVAVCTLMLAVHAGIQYSFGVFFKTLNAEFGSSRAAVSGVYSTYTIVHGIFAILMGWLADRFGPARIAAFCYFLVGLGLILSIKINAFWQLYVTYGLLVGVGLSASFAISTGTTARWFVKHRGLALGIVSSGVGLGTLTMLPAAERLITSFGWRVTYLIMGIAAWAVMISNALVLRRDPHQYRSRALDADVASLRPITNCRERQQDTSPEIGMTLRSAMRSSTLWVVMAIFLLFNFCLQMIMVHLVNYATDLGIAPLVAATLVSTIGIGSIVGRLVMGLGSDKIGSNNAAVICCAILVISLLWLLLARQLWMFYVFAVIFGFAYGGEIPQMPALVSHFFGLRAVAALVGTIVLGHSVGGALGSWAGGRIFDVTRSYGMALIIAIAAGLCAVIFALILRGVKVVSDSR